MLNDILREFYASVQSTKVGGEYSVAGLMSIRAGINRSIPHFNIITDTEFKSRNAVFKAMLKCYRKSSKDTSAHHPRITESDLEIIRSSSVPPPDTPASLVRKVWFDIQLCFAGRGREGNRELTRSSFVMRHDEDDVEYINLAHNPETKNHKDPTASNKENLRKCMFTMPGIPTCPVQSFKSYVSKCPDNATAFYPHLKRIPESHLHDTQVWYTREPMGVNYLGHKLKVICEEVSLLAPLSRVYTNHSLWSTAMGWLSDAGLESHQIKSVTGHRCETSLRSYWVPGHGARSCPAEAPQALSPTSSLQFSHRCQNCLFR